MPLYYVAYETDEGINLDWFVQADTPEEAVNLWWSPDLVQAVCTRQRVTLKMGTSPKTHNPTGSVILVPPNQGPKGPIPWDQHTITHFHLV